MEEIIKIIRMYTTHKIKYNEYYTLLNDYITNNINSIDIKTLIKIKEQLNKKYENILFNTTFIIYINNYYKDSTNIQHLFDLIIELKIEISDIAIQLLSNPIIKDSIVNIDNINFDKKYLEILKDLSLYLNVVDNSLSFEFKDYQKYYPSVSYLTGESSKYYDAIIYNIPLLTSIEEIYLFKKLEEGDTKAKEILITRNLKLARNMAYKLSTIYEYKSIDDLIQVGNLTLVKSIELYNYKNGKRFSSFLAFQMARDMRRFIINDSNMIVPEDLTISNTKRKNNKFNIAASKALNNVDSINRLLNNEEGDELINFLTDDNSLYNSSKNVEETVILMLLKEEVDDIIASTIYLTEREKTLLKYYQSGEESLNKYIANISLDIGRANRYLVLNNASKKILRDPRMENLVDYIDSPELGRKKIELERVKQKRKNKKV